MYTDVILPILEYTTLSTPHCGVCRRSLCFEGARLGAILALPRDLTKGRRLQKWGSLYYFALWPVDLASRGTFWSRLTARKEDSRYLLKI